MTLLPGIVTAALVALAGTWLGDVLGHAVLRAQGLVSGSSPISGVPIAIVLGVALRNSLRLPMALKPGLQFCVSTLLRAGIVCVGIRLSAFDVLRSGLAGLPVVIASITAGIVFVTWFNRRLGLPSRLGTLIAAGTSICGVTAIVSTAPAIDADERDVAYAIANVVAFGLFGMLAYPYLAHAFLARSETIGLFLGTAVHDTSQVIGAALTYRQLYADEIVLRVATVTKLTRNLFLAGVIPLLTWMHRRHTAGEPDPSAAGRPATALVPTFVIGFLVMAAVRTGGDATLGSLGAAYGVWEAEGWKRVTDLVGDLIGSRVLLGTAMAAVGLNTSFAVFRGVGLKPFVVGFAGAMVVGLVGLLMALLMGGFLQL